MKLHYRVISLIMTLALVVGILPFSAIISSAETTYDGQCGDNAFYTYNKSSQTLTITGEGDMYDFSSSDLPWYEELYYIKSIVVSSGITYIGDYSFMNCYNLETVSIADTVEIIGVYAFEDCRNLLSVNIPSSVREIRYGAFWWCEKLSNVVLNEGLEVIEGDVFLHTAISSIYIPSTVVDLTDYWNVDYNGENYCNPFQNCNKLSRIEVGDGNPTYTVKNGALYNKNGNALIACPKISGEFSVPDETKWIATGCFYECSNITGISIPTSVTTIGYSSFENCSSLRELVIPEGVRSIDERAFAGCSSMEKIILPSTLTDFYISESVFEDCYKLTEIIVASSNKNYTSQDGLLYNKNKTVLYACIPTKSGILNVPSSVQSISSYAFSGCAYLTEVNLSENVRSITYNTNDHWSSDHCFDSCLRGVGLFSSPFSNLRAINVDPDNQYFQSENGVLYSKDKKTLISFPSGKDGDFTIPGCVQIIGESAFVFSHLSNLIIPASVSTIKDMAICGFKKLESIRFLNSTCKFEDDWSLSRTDSDDCETTIYAPSGSTAHKFAMKRNFDFVSTSDLANNYKEDTLGLYYSFDKSKIELGDVVNVGADFIRGNSLGMKYDGDIRWELSDPEVLQVESYNSNAAVLYFKAIGLGSCDITLYLDGKEVCSDTVTVKVSDKTLIENNSEYVFNSSSFSTLNTARDTCRDIIDGCDGSHRAFASFFHSIENGLGLGVITKETLALAGLTTSMAEDAEDKAVEMLMMELIGFEDIVGGATKKIEKTYKIIKTGYGLASSNQDKFFKTVSDATNFSVDQVKELYNNVDSFKSKTDITFDVLDVTMSAVLISQFELETIKDMQNATAYGSLLYNALDRLYEKRENLVAYATNRFLNDQAIGLCNDLIGKLGGSTYKIAQSIGYLSKVLYDEMGGLDAEDYLVACNAWAYAGYLYNSSLKNADTPEKFERYYKYYVAAVKSALKSAVAISRNYRLTNIADSLYEQINLTCSYDSYLDSVRDDLKNVCSVSKETLENGKVFACYGGGIASYALSNELEIKDVFSVPAYIEGSKIEGILDYGFTGISDVKGIMLPQTIQTIGEYAFANSSMNFVYLNSGLTTIGEGAFGNCSNLRFVSLPDTLEKIQSDAFANCNLIEDVTFGEKVETVAAGSFKNCYNLSVVRFDNKNTVIEEGAFDGCNQLVIYGHEGSTAQLFASTYGYEFVAYENNVIDMKIITAAEQRELFVGDKIDTAGLSIEVTYMDQTTEIIESGWLAVCNTTSGGEKNVVICYKNGTLTYPVTVNKKVLTNVSLQEDELTLFITDSYQLEVLGDVILPLEELVWSSDDTDIVHVSESGLITCNTTGSVTVSVCDQEGIVLDTCIVSVVNKEEFEATDEAIKTTVFSPDKAGYYSYYSIGSTENITAVLYNTDGKIIGMDSGVNIKICTWLVDTDAYYMEISTLSSNLFSVSVAPSVTAESLAITTNEYSDLHGTEYKLDVSFIPETAIPESVTWSSSDTDIVSVDRYGGIMLLSTGTATITAVSESGLVATCTVNVEDYPTITVDNGKTVEIDADNPYAYFYFTPEEDGYYCFYSVSGYDTYGYILDSDFNQLSYNDDSGDGSNFKVGYQMEAGITYVMKARFYSESSSGSFDVFIEKSKVISNLEIVSLPTKLEYIKGFANNISYDGLKLKVTWSDGSTTEWENGVDSNYIGDEIVYFYSYDANVDGTIRISCGGKEVSYTLTLLENPVDHLEIVSGTAKSYIENYNGYVYENDDGEFFYYNIQYPSDAVIKIVYKDGTSTIAKVGEKVGDYSVYWDENQYEKPWVVGTENKLIISYLGHTVDLPITVEENKVSSIEVVSGKITCIENTYGYNMGNGYYYYYSIPSDITVKINYTDGSSKTVGITESVDGYSFSCSADQYENPWVLGDDNYVTLLYLGKKTQLPVSVIANPVDSIEINCTPTREYIYGDSTYGYLYSDGSYSFYPTDLTGLTFTVYYTDGTNSNFTYDDIENGKINGYAYNLNYSDYNATLGDFSVKFEYMGKSADYTVVLKESPIASIEITKQPTNINYDRIYLPDFIGMEITVTYTDGTVKVVTLTADNLKYTYSPYDKISYKVDIDGHDLRINRYDGEDVYYVVTYIDKKCEFRDIVFTESKVVDSIELDNVSWNGEGMVIKVMYTDETTETLTVNMAYYYDWGDSSVSAYGKTENGLLYYGIKTHTDGSGNAEKYTVSVLGEEIDVEVKKVILGDVNCDGIVSSIDITYMARALVSGISLSSGADINGDGKITSTDYTLLIRNITGSMS